MSELHIDTDACRNYAQKIEQVISIYQCVSNEALSISMDNAQIVADNGEDLESQGESWLAVLRSIYTKKIIDHMGPRRLRRIKTHFTDVADQMESVEEKLMSRGERLYDL